MKNSTRPLFLLHETLHLALCIQAGSVLLASAKLRFVRWAASTQHTFTLLESNGRCFTPLQQTLGIAHGDLKLMCGCSAMKPISWSSRRTVIVLTLLPEAVWNSVVSVATEDKLFLRAARFSTQLSRSVSLPLLCLDISTSLSAAPIIAKPVSSLWGGSNLFEGSQHSSFI
jgi:hypothetical protein